MQNAEASKPIQKLKQTKMNNHKYMQNTITENYHWKQDNTHLHRVAEFAIMPILFSILFILVLLLS